MQRDRVNKSNILQGLSDAVDKDGLRDRLRREVRIQLWRTLNIKSRISLIHNHSHKEVQMHPCSYESRQVLAL